LNNVFRDEFYYGMLISGDTVTDLNEVSEYYKPMITKAEFQILQEKYQENPIVQVKYKTKDDYEDIKVFDSDFLVSEDNYSLTFTLPNRKRYLTKIEKAKAE